ncbi:LysR family transcriptional regulator [Oceaniferula spumae]|uniref:LysR family transcriptional regulator n=1 Tax=Oceaniferula spumae TaxID=2979115 RepID=A0AAT9FMN2_9BACT
MNNPKLDLNDLHLLHLIHHHRSITAAAEAVNLTQSTLSRRLQAIELELGIQLFKRTTRKLNITPAGRQLLRDTAAIPNILDSAIQRISEDYLGAEKRITIGVSPALSLAHLPGIFHQQTNLLPEVKILISQPSSDDIIRQVTTNQLDLGIVTHHALLESAVHIHHQMLDRFSIIMPAAQSAPSLKPDLLKKWAQQQSWILPPASSPSRVLIDDWLSDLGIRISPLMELENFDLMCQLCALKMGVAFIPKRALTAFPRKRQLQHLTLLQPPERKLSVIGPKNTVVPTHISTFTESILFS